MFDIYTHERVEIEINSCKAHVAKKREEKKKGTRSPDRNRD